MRSTLCLVRDCECAHFDDNAAREFRCNDGARGQIERFRIGQAGDDGRRFGGDFGDIHDDFDTGTLGFPGARRIRVVTDDTTAGGHEIFRKRAAHDAEANDANNALVFLRCSHSAMSFGSGACAVGEWILQLGTFLSRD